MDVRRARWYYLLCITANGWISDKGMLDTVPILCKQIPWRNRLRWHIRIKAGQNPTRSKSFGIFNILTHNKFQYKNKITLNYCVINLIHFHSREKVLRFNSTRYQAQLIISYSFNTQTMFLWHTIFWFQNDTIHWFQQHDWINICKIQVHFRSSTLFLHK